MGAKKTSFAENKGDSEADRPKFISSQVESGRYFFGNMSPKTSREPRIVCAGSERCGSGYFLNRKSFGYYALEYIAEGEWELECGGRIFHLGPGSVFAYAPDTAFTLSLKSGAAALKYFLDFACRGGKKVLKDNSLEAGVPVALVQGAGALALFEQCVGCAGFETGPATEIGSHLLCALLGMIRENSRLTAGQLTASLKTFLRCRAYILENYARLGSVSEAARKCFVGEAYLCRLFKAHSAQTPLEFLTMLKMNHAADLIVRQNCSVKEAAAQVGYADPYHFSRLFKKTHALSPKNFALKILKQNAR